jgi:hypothetical protein
MLKSKFEVLYDYNKRESSKGYQYLEHPYAFAVMKIIFKKKIYR